MLCPSYALHSSASLLLVTVEQLRGVVLLVDAMPSESEQKVVPCLLSAGLTNEPAAQLPMRFAGEQGVPGEGGGSGCCSSSCDRCDACESGGCGRQLVGRAQGCRSGPLLALALNMMPVCFDARLNSAAAADTVFLSRACSLLGLRGLGEAVVGLPALVRFGGAGAAVGCGWGLLWLLRVSVAEGRGCRLALGNGVPRWECLAEPAWWKPA